MTSTSLPTAAEPAEVDVAPVGTAGRPAAGARPRLTFTGVVKAEWLKLRTLRSTWITLGVAVLVLVAAALLVSSHLHDDLAHPSLRGDRGPRNALTTPLLGYNIAQLVIAVLGVLTISGEYATGMIRSSFAAVPKRLPVLWAKLLVFGAVALAASTVGVLAAFFAGQAILGSYGRSLTSANAPRAVFGLAVYLMIVGLLALAIGFMVRSTAGGIATVVGVLLVLPGVLEAFGTSWATTASHYLPSNAGQGLFGVDNDPGTLSAWAGLGVLVLWLAAATAGAAVLVTRRDA